MDVIDRLNAAVKASGKPLKKIAHDAGMSSSKLTRLLRRQLHARIADVEAVLGAIGLTMRSLYAGEAEVDVRLALRALTEYVDKHEAAARGIRPKRSTSRVVRSFPVAATPNVELFDDGKGPRKRIPDELWERGARHAAKAIGDSMVDEGIDDGDIVFFRPYSRKPKSGDLVIIRVNTGIYLKRYEEVRGEKRLTSANGEKYRPIVIQPEDEVELFGVVVR